MKLFVFLNASFIKVNLGVYQIPGKHIFHISLIKTVDKAIYIMKCYLGKVLLNIAINNLNFEAHLPGSQSIN